MKLFKEIEQSIIQAYTEGVTISEAEKLAAKCLHAQIKISDELKNADLNARMSKSGLKAIKSAVYLNEKSKAEKKPTEAELSALVDSNELVSSEQKTFDTNEVELGELNRLYDICHEGHIFFRGIAKGKFE